MINVVNVLHHDYFCKIFLDQPFQYKIAKPFVKLNVGLVTKIQLARKELA